MCGIAGLFDPGLSTATGELGRLAEGMAACVVHRGPDDRGVWVDANGGLAFGHQRLSIVAIGPEGHQPMVSSDGGWVITYNGEAYNFKTLRSRLEGDGVTFRGGCDTEVVLEAVQRWGVEPALDALEGMFAFAAWDVRRRRLFLARDRFGEKPLYYGWVGGRLAFASELKAIAGLPGFAAELDRDALALYLRRNCIPAPMTAYRGVAKLVPGELVTFEASAGVGSQPKRWRYWSARRAIEEALADPLVGSDHQLVDTVEDTLARSVSARMVADVPLGAFLSGGVDSSLVVALMQRHSPTPVRTFTIGFADLAFDESVEATAVAAHLGTDHTCLEVTEGDAAEVIPELPGIWDEPFGDISQIPELLVSRLARTAVTVSLSGDGGDELFAGYNRHAWLERLWARSERVPAPIRRHAGATLGRIPPGLVDRTTGLAGFLPVRWQLRNPSTKLVKVGQVLASEGPDDAYESLVSHWDDATSIVLGATQEEDRRAPVEDGPWLAGVTQQMLWRDVTGYLPDDILTKVDRAAMAVSLETRAPFLDRDLFSLAWRLPMDLKLRNGETKWVLRQVLYRHVPARLIERPKMGFGLPIGTWLRGSLRPWAEELLAPGRLRRQGLLDPEPIGRAWQQHLSGRRDLGYKLWDVLALQSWLERWAPEAG